jgi:hypothetical protein
MACELVKGAKSAQVGGDVGLIKGDYGEGEMSESRCGVVEVDGVDGEHVVVVDGVMNEYCKILSFIR